MNKTCLTCGTQLGNDVWWTDLNGYVVSIFPHVLMVLTDAPKEEFDKAVEIVKQSHISGDIRNIDDVLKEQGFTAVCGMDTEHKVEL